MARKQYVAASAITLVVAVCSAVVWFIRSPHAALISIKESAVRRDVADLQRRIDFESLKRSIKILIANEADGRMQDRRGGAVAKLLVGAIVSPVVDAAVTPESIVMMFSGKLPMPHQRTRDENRDGAPDQNDASMDKSTSWDGLSLVRVRMQPVDRSNQGVVFVLKRDGLLWRLTGIER